jgi:hypothetical protein
MSSLEPSIIWEASCNWSCLQSFCWISSNLIFTPIF